MIISDGGVESGKGYFGVVLAVRDVVIACVRGVARGDPRTMCSFRAEAYGFLAGICLQNCLVQLVPDPSETHNTIHTDSASLLSRLQQATTKTVPAGFWLKPDSDIVQQIVHEAKSITHLQRMYAKGHQDKKKKYSELTQPERYNVDADASATKMRFEMTEPAATIIPFPQHGVNVYIQDQLISSSLDTRLMEMFTVEDYWRYYEKKYDWTKATRKLIDWDMYHTTLHQQTTLHHQQLMKYANGWLPTGHSLHRQDEHEDHRCPHCRTVQEKDPHLLRCPHPDRVAQRTKLLTITLTNYYHQSNTAQPIRELISQSLIQWFANPSRPHQPHRTHPLLQASNHQQAIGWSHFLQGRIAYSIIEYQEQYYRDRDRPDKDNKLIKHLWNHFFDVWIFRCAERHKLDTSRDSQQQTHRAQARTRAVYAALDQLPAVTRTSHYFDTSLEQQIKTPTRLLETWLAHTELLVQQGLAEAAQSRAAGHRDIRDYFPPTT
jgi:hypothetical protein